MAIAEQTAKIQTIRDEMPAVTRYAYLNTGTFGPLPRAAVEAMAAHARAELDEGRISPQAGYQRAAEFRARAKSELAQIFNVRPDSIALTRHTTDGMNIAVSGLNWQPGDEIVISDLEHPGGQLPVYNVARRFGVVPRLARLGDGSGDVVGEVQRLFSPRTRMLVISHLTWNTGAILPLAELVDVAHRQHILVVVDAAQAAGAIAVDLTQLGVDVYAGPGQKWLCGPEGTGFVYVSDEAMDRIQPTFVGYVSSAGMEHVGGYFTPKRTAERFEVGGTSAPVIAGQAAALGWIREKVGFEWAYQRIAELGQYAWERLAAIDGVSLITPRQQMVGLVAFTVRGMEPPSVVEQLAARDVVIRSIADPACLRVSTGFYNTREDIDRLANAVEELARSAVG